MHEVVSSVGLLEAKNGPGTSESKIFHGCMDGEKLEPDEQRSARSEQSEVNGCLTSGLGSKNLYF